MTTITNIPNFRPALDLDFVNSGKVDPRIQCSRSGVASYFGSDGKLRTVGANVPRIDYDPLTGKCLGLMVEEASANLLLHSADLTNAVWSKTLVTVSTSSVVSPDGTTFASRLVPDAVSGQKFVGQSVAVVSGTTYTHKVFAKADGYSWAQISTSTGFNPGFQNINLNTGEYGNGDVPGATRVRKLRNGWVEISMSSVATSSTAGRFLVLPLAVDAATRLPTIAGDGVNGILVWGGQLEANQNGTSYIPTTSSSVTRGAENLSLDFSVSSIGAVIANVSENVSSTANTYIVTGININNQDRDHFYLYINGSVNTTNWWCKASNIDASGGNVPFRANKISLRFSDYLKYATLVSGNSTNNDTSGRTKDFSSVINRILIGRSRVNTGYLNGHFERLSIYSSEVTTEQLQRLTS